MKRYISSLIWKYKGTFKPAISKGAVQLVRRDGPSTGSDGISNCTNASYGREASVREGGVKEKARDQSINEECESRLMRRERSVREGRVCEGKKDQQGKK